MNYKYQAQISLSLPDKIFCAGTICKVDDSNGRPYILRERSRLWMCIRGCVSRKFIDASTIVEIIEQGPDETYKVRASMQTEKTKVFARHYFYNLPDTNRLSDVCSWCAYIYFFFLTNVAPQELLCV
jgi:hypothetical protein